MDKKETAKLLALIKVAYPTAYRDMDEASTLATINMWQSTFPDAPYPIMEMAFDHFRKVSKFPPTVAEMFEELQKLYHAALEELMLATMVGDELAEKKCRQIMRYTNSYRDGTKPALNFASMGGSAFFEDKEPKFLKGEK